MSSEIQTVPASRVVSTLEAYPLGVKTTPTLGDQLPSNQSCILTDVTPAIPVVITLAEPPTIDGTDPSIINQPIDGTQLTPLHDYTLVYVFTGAAGEVFASVLVISCPF